MKKRYTTLLKEARESLEPLKPQLQAYAELLGDYYAAVVDALPYNEEELARSLVLQWDKATQDARLEADKERSRYYDRYTKA